ncbi:hypothetical protein BDP27DRAFT_1367664 [Rhodocollybia butyracea]|uniref:Uncharacterized protein n=1 Tax=Rhodocollybia butyracea TaxID=206335 RepID=A0A9P5PIH8_9AGAR|nr:hypothetical protein BDP27DRAFT_1367664 [Rhodocollybia butyracea]
MPEKGVRQVKAAIGPAEKNSAPNSSANTQPSSAMTNEAQKADQITFHLYTNLLFYVVNDALATAASELGSGKVDKWAPREIQVLLSIPKSITNNQVLVYITPDSSRIPIESKYEYVKNFFTSSSDSGSSSGSVSFSTLSRDTSLHQQRDSMLTLTLSSAGRGSLGRTGVSLPPNSPPRDILRPLQTHSHSRTPSDVDSIAERLDISLPPGNHQNPTHPTHPIPPITRATTTTSTSTRIKPSPASTHPFPGLSFSPSTLYTHKLNIRYQTSSSASHPMRGITGVVAGGSGSNENTFLSLNTRITQNTRKVKQPDYWGAGIELS